VGMELCFYVDCGFLVLVEVAEKSEVGSFGCRLSYLRAVSFGV
jgi:hypothetical protein